jgi:Acyl-CoA dehydrogenase, C-terminal domain
VPAADIEEDVRQAIRAAAKDSPAFGCARLTELGWDELLEDEPRVAVVALFEEMGRLRLTGPALDAVVLKAVGGSFPWPDTRVMYPEPGQLSVRPDGQELAGVAFDGLDDPISTVLVPLATPEGPQLHTLPAAACSATPVTGLDESAAMYRIRAGLASAAPAGTRAGWPAGLMAARRALAHALIGVAGELLDIAVAHVTVREQFGRPLGANQAVQHSLADAKVELSAAQELAAEAWLTCTPLAAAVAKGMASRAADTVAAHGQQVLGGIGYTWEHPWRHPLRRALLWSALLGSADECDTETGHQLARSGVDRIGHLTGVPA